MVPRISFMNKVICIQITQTISLIKTIYWNWMFKGVSHRRALEHNWGTTTFSFLVWIVKFLFEITQELANYILNMNLITVLEFFMMITLVLTRHNVPPKPRHEGNIESSSSRAEVGMYFCSHLIQFGFHQLSW